MTKKREPFERWGQIKGIKIRHRAGDKITVLQASSRGRHGMWHNVDLEAYNLNGRCDCEAFQFNCESKAMREQRLPQHERRPWRCDHLKAAREWLLTRFLRDLVTPKGTALHNQHP